MNEFIVCEVCGFAKTPQQLKQRWDGLWVCEDDYEPRHPSDFIKVPAENPPTTPPTPEPPDIFTTVNYVI